MGEWTVLGWSDSTKKGLKYSKNMTRGLNQSAAHLWFSCVLPGTLNMQKNGLLS